MQPIDSCCGDWTARSPATSCSTRSRTRSIFSRTALAVTPRSTRRSSSAPDASARTELIGLTAEEAFAGPLGRRIAAQDRALLDGGRPAQRRARAASLSRWPRRLVPDMEGAAVRPQGRSRRPCRPVARHAARQRRAGGSASRFPRRCAMRKTIWTRRCGSPILRPAQAVSVSSSTSASAYVRPFGRAVSDASADRSRLRASAPQRRADQPDRASTAATPIRRPSRASSARSSGLSPLQYRKLNP